MGGAGAETAETGAGFSATGKVRFLTKKKATAIRIIAAETRTTIDDFDLVAGSGSRGLGTTLAAGGEGSTDDGAASAGEDCAFAAAGGGTTLGGALLCGTLLCGEPITTFPCGTELAEISPGNGGPGRNGIFGTLLPTAAEACGTGEDEILWMTVAASLFADKTELS